jgi:hypothetical protein
MLSFFSIVTFLGWTLLHATWIKPEVVATKKYTGYLHYRFITTGFWFLWSLCCSYTVCVFWVLVCPCQLFVRLWYHVSDVLDLSLVSKRFGFWPHITHVIVLTFKEIKHLSDCRTIGLSDYRSDPASFHKAKNSIQGKTNCKNVVKHAPESSGNQWKGNCWGTCMVNPWFSPTYL